MKNWAFDYIYIAAWLSHINGTITTEGTVSLCSSRVSQTTTKHTFLIALYSASVEDKAIVRYFLDFHDIVIVL